ncbi:hypothetical protein NUW58_g332 [Xylaria curta]|uniref:Uncharacterized protein n=1 Tax=Xylaria curta TaxID=42375 RepID=A0ACC1PQS9_9PEZI|nr:hypothetical protein NUW58_g332 [Xylaria curta]
MQHVAAIIPTSPTTGSEESRHQAASTSAGSHSLGIFRDSQGQGIENPSNNELVQSGSYSFVLTNDDHPLQSEAYGRAIGASSISDREPSLGPRSQLNPTLPDLPPEPHMESSGHPESASEADEVPSTPTMTNEGTGQSILSVRLGLQESLGTYGILVLVGGGLVVIGAWGFLVFLWFGGGHEPNYAQAPQFWLYLMFNGWITQSITLSSLVLRLIVSAQVTICTSLLASLILEKYPVPVSETARYSVLRGVNDGPFGLIQLAFSRIRYWKNTFRRVELLLLIIIFLVALAINFSSTVLLSDIEFSEVAHRPSIKDVNLVFNYSQPMYVPASEYWTQRPRAYAAFGEINSGLAARPNSLGVSDTGLVRRVFLSSPNASERMATSLYSGPAWVMNSRTICMPPDIRGLISVKYLPTNGTMGQFLGNISYSTQLRRARLPQIPLCDNQKCLPTQFECVLPSVAGLDTNIQATNEWVHSLCFLLSPRNFPNPHRIEPPQWNIDDSPVSASSSVHLVLSTNGPMSFWEGLGNETISTKSSETYGEWRSYSIGEGISVNASICFSSVNVTISRVTLQALGKISEPTIYLDKDTKRRDTSAVRVQLGTNESVQDFAQRGVFRVESITNILPEGSQDVSQPFNSTVAETTASVLQNAIGSDTFPLMDVQDHTINICDLCQKYGTGVDNEISALISDVFRYTKRAATAITTTWSILGQSLFFDLLDLFDVSGKALVVSTSSVQVPLRREGFSAVSVLLAVHLAVVAVVTTFYIVNTRYSRQGNLWHAISQIVCHETQTTLTRGNEMKDDAIVDLMKNNDHLVTLGRSKDTGKVELVKVVTESYDHDRAKKPKAKWNPKFISKLRKGTITP